MTEPQYYNLKLQVQGRLLVPPSVRKDLNVQEGDEMILIKDEQGYHLTTRMALIEQARGSLARDDGRDLTAELHRDRRTEAEQKGW
jgi:bifunctional DNA-binding transcriptional regulator/antitoxin component of YhaV-PrlF toxin-antitoxin module